MQTSDNQPSAPAAGSSSDLRIRPYVVKLRLKNYDPQFNTTVLSLDGGGMRGLVAAAAAARVEQILGARVKSILQSLQTLYIACKENEGNKAFQQAAGLLLQKYELHVYSADTKELRAIDTYEDLDTFIASLPSGDFTCTVNLCDYFDIMAGTSAGAILASYFATRGGTAQDKLLKPAYDGEYAEEAQAQARLKDFLNLDDNHPLAIDSLVPGSAVAASAVMVSMGRKIFGHPAWLPEQLDKIPNLLGPKYSDEPVSEVLRKVLGDGDPIKFKCDGKLQTCLVVPTLQTDLNRAVVFWASPQQAGMNDAMHGYAVVHYPTNEPQVASQAGQKTEDAEQRPPKKPRLSLPGEKRAARAFAQATIANFLPSKPATKSTMLKSGIFSIIIHSNEFAYELWKVVRASTAAPTFFPAQKIQLLKDCNEEGHFVDGGMVANNPAQQAIAFALMLQKVRESAQSGTSMSAAMGTSGGVVVLSIGCGQSLSDLRIRDNASPGEWALHLADVLLGSAQDTATATGLQILNTIYPPKEGCQPRLLRVQCSTFEDSQITREEADLPAHNLQDSTPFAQGVPGGDVKKVLTTMDDPDAWKTLIDIGNQMAKMHETMIGDWVKTYVLPYDIV